MAYTRSEGLPHCLIMLKKMLLLHNNLDFLKSMVAFLQLELKMIKSIAQIIQFLTFK